MKRELRYVPTERRVRADDVVDTTRPLLGGEPRRIVPSFAVPDDDLDVVPGGDVAEAPGGVLHPGIPFAVHTAPGEPVLVGGRAGAGFRLAELDDQIALDFSAFDAWYEEG